MPCNTAGCACTFTNADFYHQNGTAINRQGTTGVALNRCVCGHPTHLHQQPNQGKQMFYLIKKFICFNYIFFQLIFFIHKEIYIMFKYFI